MILLLYFTKIGHRATLNRPDYQSFNQSMKTEYENSFRIKASRHWNLLPKSINSVKKLDLFKVASGIGDYFKGFLDTPPVPSYTTVNRNSLLDWTSLM